MMTEEQKIGEDWQSEWECRHGPAMPSVSISSDFSKGWRAGRERSNAEIQLLKKTIESMRRDRETRERFWLGNKLDYTIQ